MHFLHELPSIEVDLVATVRRNGGRGRADIICTYLTYIIKIVVHAHQIKHLILTDNVIAIL